MRVKTKLTFLGALALALLLNGASAAAGEAARPAYHFIEGSFTDQRQPDGNSVVFEDDEKLIVFDTGRHPEHTDKILAYATQIGKPITAIINSHWHLDHSTGNTRIRQKFPQADLYASDAVKGALNGFLIRNEARNRAMLDDPAVPDERKTDIRLYLAAIGDPQNLIANKPVTHALSLPFGKQSLELRIATRAATEGDVWLIDRHSETVFVGDLVVVPVPFFDTACANGWQAALEEIARTPFKTLVPGHGKPMSRSAFEQYKNAFDRLVHCANSEASAQHCAEGWAQDAKPFVQGDPRVADYILYYVNDVLRSEEKTREYCGKLAAVDGGH